MSSGGPGYGYIPGESSIGASSFKQSDNQIIIDQNKEINQLRGRINNLNSTSLKQSENLANALKEKNDALALLYESKKERDNAYVQLADAKADNLYIRKTLTDYYLANDAFKQLVDHAVEADRKEQERK